LRRFLKEIKAFFSLNRAAPLEKPQDFNRRIPGNSPDGVYPVREVKRDKGNSLTGFTFIEVLMACLILAFALIPIMLWVPVSIQSKARTEQKTAGIFLAQAKIEELRAKVRDNFGNNFSVDSASFSPPYQDYRYTIVDDVYTYLKTISVQVWHVGRPQDNTTLYAQMAPR